MFKVKKSEEKRRNQTELCIVHLIYPSFEKRLSRESRVESEPILDHCKKHVLVKVVLDVIAVASISLSSVKEKYVFKIFELPYSEV